MKPVYQTIFGDALGDCFRACVASIFEFPIEDMPNFWEHTQDVEEFWKLNDSWISKNKGYRCISFQFDPEDRHLVDGILCIACAKSPRGDMDHAVVWLDGVLHDPHPSSDGLAEEPDTFTLFIPLTINLTKG
uniref:Uncharacterized protein n=1 Tax=viral metagenome TaxID=1070528 RepID=A0A6H1ZVF7_9ZZZZ